jgi:hypothetical protein
MADDIQFSKVVKASLVFRDDFDATRHYPHILKVFLCLDNAHDSDVTWVANSIEGIKAELLDAAGKPVPQPASAFSIRSNSHLYHLPFGSRLDWLISHRGISMMGDAEDKYAIMLGGRGWLIPIEKAGTYSLRIRLRGLPWATAAKSRNAGELEVLLDLPPAKLKIIK